MANDETGPLQAPRRNKYFFGELLGVDDWQLEQTYGLSQRRLLSRLALGAGVLGGLSVTEGADGTLTISPGVAVDGWGRVIVVPGPCAGVDPTHSTDDNGTPTGSRITCGSVTVYLSYAELDADPSPEAPRIVIETYRVGIRAGLPAESFAPGDASVVLATVSLPEGSGSMTIDDSSCRAEIFSNRMLFEMIADLQQRVNALSDGGGDVCPPR
jgi:hypothetical protein